MSLSHAESQERSPRAHGARGDDAFGPIIGKSSCLARAVHRARLLGRTATSVLIQGEAGVGKALFARAIHECGLARGAPFVVVDCTGEAGERLASELFESEGIATGVEPSDTVGALAAAHGGTLVLDEVAALPLAVQPYLLRVLEDGVVLPRGHGERLTFRTICTSRRDLWSEVAAERFRMDLFYRVAVTTLRIPSLRERTGDVPLLVEHFARELAAQHGRPVPRFSRGALHVLARSPWPGNVRELRELVEAQVLCSLEEVEERDLGDLATMPAPIALEPPRERSRSLVRAEPRQLERDERESIDAALRSRGGNLTQVARELRMARSTLYLKLKKYGLEDSLRDLREGAAEAE